MSDTLHLNIDRADGSLQRLIGLVERRGFHIDGISMADMPSDGGTARRIALTVRGRDDTRCVDTLGRQIDRLFGVSRATSVAAYHSEAA